MSIARFGYKKCEHCKEKYAPRDKTKLEIQKYCSRSCSASGANNIFYKHGNATRGLTGSYRSWMSMLNRCYTAGAGAYSKYGAKGIKVCDRWRGDDGFSNFLHDMGERPDGMSLDRINATEDYSPKNCRWATSKQQSLNKTNTVRINYKGTNMTLFEAVEKYGDVRKYSTYYYRYKNGWTSEKIIEQPIATSSFRKEKI